MTMSKDRVRFYLPRRYFQTGPRTSNTSTISRGTCQRILQRAFDMCFSESEGMMQQHPDGFSIICRPSQFARFVVYRYEADECINGVKDFKPMIVDAREVDPQQEVADSIGISRGTVVSVLQAVGFNGPFERDKLHGELDVAKRPHQRCYP